MFKNKYCWITLTLVLILFFMGTKGRADSINERTRYTSLGLNGGYATFKDSYGDKSVKEKNHWYGGAIYGLEAGLMWPVAKRLDLGARLRVDAGYLKGACDSVTCGPCSDMEKDDENCDGLDATELVCTCKSSKRFTMLATISSVLAVPIRDWIWLEVQLGFFLWMDGNSVAWEPNFFGGGAVGFNIIDKENVDMFVLLEFNGALRNTSHWGIIPQATVGVRF